MVYIDTILVKQPVENLTLSNALHPVVLGFVKTLSQEVARDSIAANLLEPGMHNTAAHKRLFVKKSELEGIRMDEARLAIEKQIPVGKMTDANEKGSFT